MALLKSGSAFIDGVTSWVLSFKSDECILNYFKK